MATPSELPEDSPLREAMRKELQAYKDRVLSQMDRAEWERLLMNRPIFDPPYEEDEA